MSSRGTSGRLFAAVGSEARRWTACSAVESWVSWFARTSRVGGDVDEAEEGGGKFLEGVRLPLVVLAVVLELLGAVWAS